MTLQTNLRRMRFVCLLFLWGSLASAATSVDSGLPSIAGLKDMLAQVDNKNPLDDESKAETLASLQAALGSAELAELDGQAIQSFTRQAEDAEKALASLREEQQQLQDPGTLEAPPSDVADLDSWILRQQVKLDLALERQMKAEGELSYLRTRPDAIRENIAQNSRELSDLPVGDLSPGSQPGAIQQAWAREAILAQTRRLEVELSTLDTRQQVASAESRNAALQVDRLQTQLDIARDRLAQVRMEQMRQTSTDVKEAQLAMEGAPPFLREIAAQNAAMADAMAVDAADTHTLSQQLIETQAQQKSVHQSLEWVNEILAIDNLPAVYSEQLRAQQQKMSWIRQVEQSARKRQQEAASKQLSQLEVRVAFQSLSEMEFNSAGQNRGPQALSKSDRGLEQTLMATQQKLLEERERILNEYQRVYNMLSLTEVELLSDGREILQMLNSRLLWTRSQEEIRSGWFRELRLNSLALGSDPVRYFGTAGDRWDLFRRQQLLWLAGIAFFALSFPLASRMRRRIQVLAERTDRLLTDRFAYTIEALIWAVARAAMGPLILLYSGWLMTGGVAGDLLQGAGYGLMHASWVLFGCALIRGLCRSQGLVAVHFRWPESTRLNLFRTAGRARWVYPPLTAFTLLCLWNGEAWLRSGPGRLGFLLILISLAWMVHRLFRNRDGVLREWLAGVSLPLQRLIPFCRFLMVSVLLVLAVATIRGYLYTARVMLLQLVSVAAVLFAAVLVYNLALRWLRIAHRRYAIAQIRKRRKESKAAEQEAPEGEGAGIQLKDLEGYDADQLNDQTRRLVRLAVILTTAVVLLGLLRPLFPALGFFNTVNLWTNGSGQIITLRSLLMALLTAFLTVTAAHNIPGLMEMALLPITSLKNSSRFAVVTLSRYVIVLTGLILGFGAIGIGWTQIQWLAAAITVGLGFGLQEIFANFVSGIILLFEQPIRVGDVVTVDTTTGLVTRIQMRATTITDWDRKEFIVPNKEFISGRLLNWTLSDNVTRVLIHIGVAYGSNVRLALELLAKVADQNPTVLKDPKPAVNFEAFGDSTLDLSMRAYLPSLDNRLAITTDLLTDIDDAFREAGIEIAFPQHDLHVRSIDSGVASFLKEAAFKAP